MSVGKASIKRALGVASEPVKEEKKLESPVATAKKPASAKPAAKKSAASTAKKPTVKKPAAAKAAPQKAASAPKTEKAETVFSVGDALPYYLL